MQELSEMYTIADVDCLIGQMCRNDSSIEEMAKSRVWTPEERAANLRLDGMCKALERRVQLEAEISSGFRNTDGTLNVRV